MADLNDSQVATFNNVLSGSMLTQIQGMKRTIESYAQAITDLRLRKANAAGVAKAEQSLLEMRQSLNQAISDHNKIAGWIQEYSGSNIGLAGLGGIPAIAYTIAAIGVGLVALSMALDSLAKNFLAAQGKSFETKGYIEQLGGAIGSTSSLVANVGIVAAIGTGLYVLYMVLKKRGTI